MDVVTVLFGIGEAETMSKIFIGARLLLVGLLGLGLWLAPAASYGQSRELRGAFDQTRALSSQGRYDEALPFAKETVRLGEEEFGPVRQYSC